MTRERAGGQRCGTCTWAFKASGKTSWRLSKWNFEMSVVFTTWRAYALPLISFSGCSHVPYSCCGLALLLVGLMLPGGPAVVVVLPWWLLHTRVEGMSWPLGSGRLRSPGAAGRLVLAPIACSRVRWLFSWKLWLPPGTSIQWAAWCVDLLECASKSSMVRSLKEMEL